MDDDETIKRPAAPARPAQAKPMRPAAAPHETLPGAMKRRPAEPLLLAQHRMHPFQRRPDKDPTTT